MIDTEQAVGEAPSCAVPAAALHPACGEAEGLGDGLAEAGTKPSAGRSILWAGVLFLVAVPATAHLLFSWMGYNPTDDGFILAGSRRMLDGQVPYRDFICVRPFGSYLLHLPFVLLGGDYTFWASRGFVWFEFACLAWAWSSLLSRALSCGSSAAWRLACAFLVFAFSAHTFPIMAWHSIDGLCFASVGLALCYQGAARRRALGYLLLGLAPLCRQNLLLVVPGALLAMGDWRRVRLWALAFLPGVLAAAWLLARGAAPDALVQLTSQTGFWQFGVRTYLSWSVLPWMILYGYWATHLAYGAVWFGWLSRFGAFQRAAGSLLLCAVPLGAAKALMAGRDFWEGPSFGLFACAAGATMFFLANGPPWRCHFRAGALALLLAWSISISIGCNTPALAAGPLAGFLVATAWSATRSRGPKTGLGRLRVALVGILVAATLVGFGVARTRFIYRERPASELRCSLAGLLPGGSALRTNAATHAFMADLRAAIRRTGGTPFAIVPDVVGYWARSPQPNPLLTDWSFGVELNSARLRDRVTDGLEQSRGRLVVIVQKVRADSLAGEPRGFNRKGEYPVLDYVTERWARTDETRFFELYR